MNNVKLNDFLTSTLSLEKLELIIVDVPQKEIFKSAVGIRKSRRALIVKWNDKSGAVGYGECSCRPDPFYSHEFVDGAILVLENYIFPLLSNVKTYDDLLIQLNQIRGWNFTKSAIESAANDAIRNDTGAGILEASEIPQCDKVPVGISLGLFENAESLRNKVQELKTLNYQRIKFKVSKDYSDEKIIKALGAVEHPNISFDANGSFTAANYRLLGQFAELGNVIEQPFPPGDLYLYQEYLEDNKAFKICLDEEVESYGNLVSNHLQIDELNIKPGRVGGLWNSVKMIEYCNAHGIKAWIGGMFETSIGRAQNLQMAAMLPDAKAHDLSPSNRYFEVDLVKNPIEMIDGFISKSNFNFIEIDHEILDDLTVDKKILKDYMRQLDYIIENATIVDGSGGEPFKGSVGILANKIHMLDSEAIDDAMVRIDGSGLTLTPGFIDTHASTGFGLFFSHAADHKLFQGITTEIFGNCGTSPGPIGPLLINKMHEIAADLGFDFNWRTLDEYFSLLEETGIQFNVATLTGHSTLRAGEVADWNNPNSMEQEAMKQAMAKSIRDGALGLSTGLIYAPGCFANTSEIVELAKVAASNNGIYASHMRDERDKLEEAIEETLSIGEQANINVLVSHLKSAELQNFGKIPKVIKRLEEYNAIHSVQAKIDVYPYTAVSTKLRAFIPKKFLENGIEELPAKLQLSTAESEVTNYIEEKGYDLSKMLFISNEHPVWEGKNIMEIANLERWSPAKTLLEILSRDTEVWIVYFCIDENDMDTAITWPDAMICTDSWSHPINAPKRIGVPHPRSYGAFTQYIFDYVKRKKLLSFPEAIRKITSLPASYFNIKQRGLIKSGYMADLVLFDFDKIKPNATYTQPLQLSDGVVHLWVNGQRIIADGTINDNKPGVVIRNQ